MSPSRRLVTRFCTTQLRAILLTGMLFCLMTTTPMYIPWRVNQQLLWAGPSLDSTEVRTRKFFLASTYSATLARKEYSTKEQLS